MTSGSETENLKFLPHELITEILSWLPVEPLLKFKRVCKLWCDTIQEHNFTHLHMRRYPLIYTHIIYQLYTVNPDSEGTAESFTNISSLNGIMLERCIFTNKYRIWNPCTKHILHLPSPKHIEPARIFMSFVVKTKEYKLVYCHLDKTTKRLGFEVLTIGTDSTWRPLDYPTNFHYANHSIVLGGPRLIDGVLYKLGCPMAGGVAVICLDMATEQLKEVALPSCLFPVRKVNVLPCNGKFSIAAIVQDQFHALILEDYKKCKWGFRKIVIPPCILKDRPQLREYRILYLEGGKLLYLDEGMNAFMYHNKSGKVKYLLSAEAPGNEKWVGYRPSMVHFRGMQPE